MSELIINDDNWREFIGDGHVVERGGELRMLGALPRRTAFGGTVASAADPSFLIPRSEWDARIAEKDEQKTWLADLIKPEERRVITIAEDQRSLGYCWTYCVTNNVIVCRLRQGEPLVLLSAESVGGPTNGWRDQGGWPETALKRYMSHGACPQSFMDRPNSLDPNRWQNGWQQAGLDYRVEEWLDIDFPGRTFDALVAAALSGKGSVCCYDWWGHAIFGGLKVRKVSGRYQVMHWNSWGLSEGEEGWIWIDERRSVPEGGLFTVGSVLPKD